MLDATRRFAKATPLLTESGSEPGAPAKIRLVLTAPGTFSITVSAQDISRARTAGGSGSRSNVRAAGGRAATGARVTVEFFVAAPLPRDCEVHLLYDFAGNDTWRECVGFPHLSHTKQKLSSTYHYRVSHWISAEDIERFVQR
jgi:hypothetical protein